MVQIVSSQVLLKSGEKLDCRARQVQENLSEQEAELGWRREGLDGIPQAFKSLRVIGEEA